MELIPLSLRRLLLSCCALAGVLLPVPARSAICKTQAQLTGPQRDALSNFGHLVASDVQKGDTQALKAITLPAVAADFGGIAAAADDLKSLIQQATITVDSLYLLDATSEVAGQPRTDFFCGSPVVVMNLTDLPPGMYALVILHATGVPKPQQISLILAQGTDQRWLLGGLPPPRAMTENGHDGLWYWSSARRFAQKNMSWDAWFYYQTAAYTLDPIDFLSSPNLEKLQKEQEAVKPSNLPAATKPLALSANGATYQVVNVDTTSALGAYDLEVTYAPDPSQAAQLRDPPSARKQVTDVMTALLTLRPELQAAFHGIWVHANQGNDSLFSLELTMDQIATGSLTPPLTTPPAK